MSKRAGDDHGMGAQNCARAPSGVKADNVRLFVRRAILDRFSLQPEVLRGKWRRSCTELTRKLQHQGGWSYEHAEAAAFEDVLCQMWLEGKTC